MPPKKRAWALALGREDPPATIELPGGTYRHDFTYKHDFFAFTARYQGERDRVVLKIGRKASLFGLPFGWVGRLHVWHETNALRSVEDLEIVPRYTGPYGKHGLTHEHVEGHQLARGEHVQDDFYERLRAGLAEIHARRIAYVDLEKPENVLVGDDGRPYLIDFQIAYRWPFRRGGELWPFRWLRTRLQNADRYHVTKLQRRTRPDQLTEEEIRASKRRPFPVQLWTWLTRPLIRVRRRVMHQIEPCPRTKRGRDGRWVLRRRGEERQAPEHEREHDPREPLQLQSLDD